MKPKKQEVTYWAVSILTSRTFWVAFFTLVIGVMAEPEMIAAIPLRWLPRVLIVTGLAHMALRKLTVRPVAFIAPRKTKPVRVEKVGPPTPPLVTD